MPQIRVSHVCVGLAAALAVVPMSPSLVERWYAQGLYPRLQHGLTTVSNAVPFALLDVAIAGAAVALIALAIRRWRVDGGWRSVRAVLWRLVVAAAIAYLLFVACWGLNYRRVLLEARLAYDPQRVTTDAALALATESVRQVNALRPVASPPTSSEPLVHAFVEAQHAVGDRWTAILPPPKASLLTWYFRLAAIDGMTVPWFLEIIVNPDVLPFERPFTLAHEWAHLAGYAQESEANFVAWLACIRSDQPMDRYSGWLVAYSRSARAVPREQRRALREALRPEVVSDLRDLDARLSRANPAVRDVAMGAYDRYLRANRVDEGIASYGAVLRLMLGTEFTEGWQPRRRDP